MPAREPGNWSQLLENLLSGDHLRAHRKRMAMLLAALARDERVLAIRLRGSLASGGSDRHSDINLLIDVQPAHWQQLWTDRASLLGDPLLQMECPLGATPDQVCLAALDRDGVWVDLVCRRGFAPERAGQITLWERIGLPECAPDRPAEEWHGFSEPLENRLARFWFAALRTARYIARGDLQKAGQMLENVFGLIPVATDLPALSQDREGLTSQLRSAMESMERHGPALAETQAATYPSQAARAIRQVIDELQKGAHTPV